MKIRRFDQVMIVSGDDKGKKGKVLAVFPDKQRVLVEGVNFMKRHSRARPGQQGGIVEREAPIHVSNVMLVDAESNQPARMGVRVEADGTKVRVGRKRQG